MRPLLMGTAIGRIVTTSIKARTAYFGEVQLQIANLRHLRWLVPVASPPVIVDAAQYANPNTWMETETSVSNHNGLLITATGQVDLWPQTPGHYMSGSACYQAGRGGHLPGMLPGKIGESGKPFIISERSEGTARSTCTSDLVHGTTFPPGLLGQDHEQVTSYPGWGFRI